MTTDRETLIELGLASVTFRDTDGYLSTGIRTNEDAADVLLASDWLTEHDRAVAEAAWDRAARSVQYEDGSVVEIVETVNPFRSVPKENT